MKSTLYILLFFFYAYAFPPPGQPAHLLIPIGKGNMLEKDCADKYLMDLEVYQDSIFDDTKSANDYYTYINGKNYHKFEIFNDRFLTVFPFIPGKAFIPKNSVMRLSFIEKSSNKEMNIYIRLSRDFGSEMFLELDKIKFLEGSYFFDSCKSKTKYNLKSKNKNYSGDGNIFNDTSYPINEVIDMSYLDSHQIVIAELNSLLKTDPCQ